MRYYRPTWAEVNLSNLAYNFKQIKNKLNPGIKIMACVKADAYGHGIIPVAKKLASCGTDFLGVASIDEGIRLRKAKINLPILVLGALLKKDVEPFFKYSLTPSVFTPDFAFCLNRLAKAKRKPIKIHIKVDTGMGRLGILSQDALAFIKKINKLEYLKIEGVFTHLACADTKKSFTLKQLEIFNQLISQLKQANINIPLFHCANSMGIFAYRESHFNMVRPGIALYGVSPCIGLDIGLKPVLSLKTRVAYVKSVPAGCGISYGHTYITKRKTRIVILSIGYADGYPRNLSNKAEVLIRGRRFKISGRVCMDQIMVDIGQLPVKAGDEAMLIGRQKKENISAEELAGLSGTIPYEILCGLGSRVPRVYI